MNNKKPRFFKKPGLFLCEKVNKLIKTDLKIITIMLLD